MLAQDVKDIKAIQEKILQTLQGCADSLGVLKQINDTLSKMAVDLSAIKTAVVEPPPDTNPVGTVAEPGTPTERK